MQQFPLACSLALLLPALAAAQPSFDCARAATRVEKAICADRELAADDLRMARLYQAGRKLSGDDARARLHDQQTAWLGQRDRQAGDGDDLAAALRESYLRRIAELERQVLGDAVETIPDDPRRSLEALGVVGGAPAMAWQAYIQASGDLGNQDVAAAERLFRQAVEQPSDRGRLVERFDTGDYRDVATVLRHLRFAAAYGPKIPCWVFSRHPEAAYSAFAAYFGSTLDGFPEICDDWSIMAVPEVAALDEVIDAIKGDEYNRCGWGTIRYAVYRNRQIFLLKASHNPELLELPAAAEATWDYLRKWSVETPRQGELYRQMLDRRDRAIPAVAAFYRRQGLHEPRAMRAAHAAVDGILVFEFPDCGEH